MNIDDLSFSEDALLAVEMLRSVVDRIERPDIEFNESVDELVQLLDIAAHSSSKDVVAAAQQFLSYASSSQLMFFKSVGVKVDNIFIPRNLRDAFDPYSEDDAENWYSV